MKKPTVAIVGAGSIGCYLGGKLIHAKIPTLLLGRSRLEVEIAAHGLRVSNLDGLNLYLSANEVPYTTDYSELSTADYVIVLVKSRHTKEAAESMKPHLKASAKVVGLQNGVSNGAVLSAVLGAEKVYAGTVSFGAIYQGKGHFHRTTSGYIGLPKEEGLKNLVNAFKESGTEVKQFDDIVNVLWGKLLLNMNNSVNALAGIPLKKQLKNANYRQVMALCIKECLLVMKAEGVHPEKVGSVPKKLLPFVLSLPNFLFLRVSKSALQMDDKAASSMSEDFALSRPTEVDYLNGEIIRLGKKHQIPTPVNQKMYDLVKEAERKGKGSPCISGEEMLKLVLS